jgi:hypothetical protein
MTVPTDQDATPARATEVTEEIERLLTLLGPGASPEIAARLARISAHATELEAFAGLQRERLKVREGEAS